MKKTKKDLLIMQTQMQKIHQLTHGNQILDTVNLNHFSIDQEYSLSSEY